MAQTPAKPVVLIVRDGWGENPNTDHHAFNAIALAHTPVSDALMQRYPSTLIHTCCRQVGLPEGTMGNSEVGHQNLGAGRIVHQESVRITVAIEDESFYQNQVLVRGIEKARDQEASVHLMGIASDAGVHGRLEHLYACLEACRRLDMDRVFIHLFTDGRDTGPFSGLGFVREVEAACQRIGVGKIASVMGRYYAMDRDNRWERVAQAYRCLTCRDTEDDSAITLAPTAAEAVQRYYDRPTNGSQQGDEFIVPTMVGTSLGEAVAERILDQDTVIFFNYRGDRPREITRAFILPDEQWAKVTPSPDSGERGFARRDWMDLHFITMTAYEEALAPYVQVAFSKPPRMDHIGGAWLSEKGKRQFRCAETEKFPHVTFFFNDYREEPFEGESRQMAQSPKVPTYDLKPEMSAEEITELVLDQIGAEDPVDFILVNFANGDMVGHTGVLEAAIKAVETVDACVGRIVEATLARGGKLIVTADHGNAEQMFDPETGSPHTAHTLYDVPLIVVDPALDAKTPLRSGGRLADVFPTVLDMMALDKPAEMSGESLLRGV